MIGQQTLPVENNGILGPISFVFEFEAEMNPTKGVLSLGTIGEIAGVIPEQSISHLFTTYFPQIHSFIFDLLLSKFLQIMQYCVLCVRVDISTVILPLRPDAAYVLSRVYGTNIRVGESHGIYPVYAAGYGILYNSHSLIGH
jgi:hypothetical protein